MPKINVQTKKTNTHLTFSYEIANFSFSKFEIINPIPVIAKLTIHMMKLSIFEMFVWKFVDKLFKL